ncbi:DinB family protein [Pleomorphovibrio marinus]|uniref:DinB family protein n=1 Tax=Pleomorphovibrio marinus TaxID=2164132 RepID=UPI000E0C66CE|nr:DinB family protein [Pleomorphovibrio marinus]
MDKEGTIHEVHRMYDFLEEVLESKSNEEMEETIDFGGEEMPVWRLFDIVENHSIHHRGYSLVYMRMNGVAPKGYLGW